MALRGIKEGTTGSAKLHRIVKTSFGSLRYSLFFPKGSLDTRYGMAIESHMMRLLPI